MSERDPKLKDFSSEELIAEVCVREYGHKLVIDADSDDMLNELGRRSDLPDCDETHLLRLGIEDRDWRKIEEAAAAMKIRTSFVMIRRAEEKARAAT